MEGSEILGKIFTPVGVKADFCHSTLPNVINIHLVPHSHDDVGWKETVDEYYNQGRIQIRQIYSSVIRALTEKEDRKWVLVFHSFFSHYVERSLVSILKFTKICLSVCLYVCPIFSPPSHGPISNLITFLESLHHGDANKIICSTLKAEIKKKLAWKLFFQVEMCSSM